MTIHCVGVLYFLVILLPPDMEFSSTSKPIIASNISTGSLEKYIEEISNLPKENGWSSKQYLRSYRHFWFYPYFLQGAMHARDHFQAQPSDIFLCSSMKTGCTWLKALSFTIATRTDEFDDSKSPLRTTVPHDCIPFLEYDSGCKIVYLCRDPKDTFVSMWHFFRKLVEKGKPGEVDLVSIEEAFELFCKGVSSHGPYWEHVLGYWKASLERHGKILFLKYEDIMEDTELYVKKLADFFGCPFTLEEEREGILERIIKFCSFESLSNLEVNKSGKQVKKDAFVENSAYFRKGKVGDWRNYLSAEMGDRLDNIMEEKLSCSGLTFLKDDKK